MAAAALLCFSVTMFAILGLSDGAWCVCRSDVADSTLQKAIDYACGNGAECTAINQGGTCYNPNSVRSHCSYAVNSYYQKKGQNAQACVFSGSATITTTDPSSGTCSYSSTASGAGTSPSTPSTTTSPPTSTTPTTPGSSTTTPSSGTLAPPGSTTTPSTMTPTTPGTGGGFALGPSGNSVGTDSSGVASFPSAGMASFFSVMLTFVLVVTFRA